MKEEFNFPEIDIEGSATLEAIALADRFNYWMFNTIRPFCSGKVIEIGSGIGNISNYFIRENFQIFLTDIREIYCRQLKSQFGGNPNLLGVDMVDLVDFEFDDKYKHYLNSFDTVFALNVIEHIDNDGAALANMKKLLRPGGHSIILVPAYQCLYNSFDMALEHYRRYTKDSLTAKFISEGYTIQHSQYFNAAGILGWWISGRLQGKKVIPKGQMRLYNSLVPLFKIFDKFIVFNKVGLSVIVIGRKEKS